MFKCTRFMDQLKNTSAAGLANAVLNLFRHHHFIYRLSWDSCGEPLSFVNSPEWNNLLIVGLFNIFDTIGRTLGGYKPLMIDINR